MSWWGTALVGLSVVLVALCILPIALKAREPSFDILNPRHLFSLYYALQLGVYPVLAVFSGKGFRYFDGTVPDMKWLCLGSLMSIAGIVAFNLAYDSRLWRALTPEFPQPPDLSSTRIGWLLFLMLPGIAYCIHSAFLGRGIQGYLDSFVEMRYGSGDSGRGFIFFLATAFVTITAILGLIGSTHRPKTALLRIVSIALFVVAVVTSAMTGFRGALVITLMSGLAYYHYHVRRLTVVRFVLVMTILAATVSVYGILRSNFEARSAGASGDAQVGVAEALVTRNPGLEMVAITMRGVSEEKQPFVYFWPGLVEAVTIPVPRAFWGGKPVPQSLVYGERFMSYYLFLRDGTLSENTGGISMTVIAYLYWQLGIPAVILGMAALGAGFRVLHDYHTLHGSNHAVAFAYICIYPVLTKFPEAPQDAMNGLVLTLLFVVAIVAVCGRYHSGVAARSVRKEALTPWKRS